jgi:hypothetical protein
VKELFTILEALHRARSVLESYEQQGENRPGETLREVADIIVNDEIACALEKLQASIGSPPLVPDTPPPKEASRELPPF